MISLVLLAALSAGAPQRLSGPADVVQLCRHLSALMDVPPSGDPVERAAQQEGAKQRQRGALDAEYEVRLSPREFRFGNYDAQAEVLEVEPGPRGLTVGRGLLILQPNETELALDASAAEASGAYKLWREGKEGLRITFDIDDSSRCEGSPASPPWMLAVHLLSVSVVGSDGALVLNGANGLATHDAQRDKPPGVAIQAVVPLTGKVDTARVASSLAHTEGLEQCYAKALGGAPQLEGTVVFQAKVDGRGHPVNLEVALEDLGSPTLVSCLGDSLRGMVLAGAAPGSSLLMPLELRRM